LAVEMDGALSSGPFPGVWPYKIGVPYLIKTCTEYYSGVIVAGNDKEFVLHDVCWIPQTGRFNEVMKTGVFEECEPVDGPVIVNRTTIISAFEIPNLPREVR